MTYQEVTYQANVNACAAELRELYRILPADSIKLENLRIWKWCLGILSELYSQTNGKISAYSEAHRIVQEERWRDYIKKESSWKI